MPRNRARSSLLVLILIILMSACDSGPTPAATRVIYASPESVTLADPPSTPVWIDLPAPIQLLSPTPQFSSGPQIIDPASAAQVAALTRLGKGTILAQPYDAPGGAPIYSPDGLWMAIPTSAGIYIYDAITFEELHSLPVGSTFARAPDGKALAVSGPGGVSLWDPLNGVQIGKLLGYPDVYYRQPVFSPDGALLAAASNQEIIIWSVEDGNISAALPGERLLFSPDAQLAVAMTSAENKIRMYETRDWTGVNHWNARSAGFAPGGQLWLEEQENIRLFYIDRDLATAPFPGTQPSFSSDGTAMALFGHGQISIYDHQKGRRTLTLEGSYLRIDEVQFSPDGRTIAGDVYTLRCPTCSEMDGWERSFLLWRAADGAIISRINHPSGWFAYAVDGRSLTILEPEVLQMIDTLDGSVVKRIDGFTYPVEGMRLSPDGEQLAAAHAGEAYILRLWDIESGSLEQAIPNRDDFAISNVELSYSPDGKYLAVGGDLWDLAAGQRLTGLEQTIGEKTSCWPNSVSFSPNETTLSTGCFEGQLDLWSVPDGWLLQSLGGYTSWVLAQAYSPDGRYLAAVYSVPDYLVQVWELPDGKPTFTIGGGHFTRVAYSPDGSMLATVMANEEYDQYGWPAGAVQLWRASDGVELARLGIEDAVSAAFSPDGRLLATGSLDGALRLWELDGLELVFEAREHYASIQRLEFTPDGSKLLSGSLDGTVVIWGLPVSPEGISAHGDWQTYTSAQFGFSIDFPLGWAALEVPNQEYESSIPQVWFSANGFPPPQTGARADIVLMVLDEDPSPAWQAEKFENYRAETIRSGEREALKVSGINKESRFQETAMIFPWNGHYILGMPNGTQASLEAFDRVMTSLR